jgi:A/G-specific adenine glycosylase
MTNPKADSFALRLLNWFDEHGRKDLPWQINKTPYRVWVSEIMLQQTQVTTVIDYYLRFMESFPDVKALAQAEEDKVLEHWAGLGYYARARNLHKAAKQVFFELNGDFPEDIEGLSALPGIGRSTAGAIRSIAHQKYAPILDGNVKRVLCRYHAIETWSGERATEQKLWQLADEHTPEARCDDYTQAIMDLGATLCKRSKPECERCPMQTSCLAFKTEQQFALPVSKPKKAIPQKQTWALLIEADESILLEKRPPSGIWGGLYSLPEAPSKLTPKELVNYCSEKLGVKVDFIEKHQSIHHTFSHYKLEIKPIKFKLIANKHEIRSNASYNWLNQQKINSVALPAPISSYLNEILKESLFD